MLEIPHLSYFNFSVNEVHMELVKYARNCMKDALVYDCEVGAYGHSANWGWIRVNV